MPHTGRGKSYSDGISLAKLFMMFPTDDAARQWIESNVWPEGLRCPHCGSDNAYSDIKHQSMTHRCRDCSNRPRFIGKTGTVEPAATPRRSASSKW